MRRKALLLGLTLALVGGGAIAVTQALGTDELAATTTVKVIEHATTDTVVETGKRGDTTGDLLTFHNTLYDAANKKKVGSDQGSCIRIDPKRGTWECGWTNIVPGGRITVEGVFYDRHSSTLAITGGTGTYRNARGAMFLKARKGGKEFAFVFRLEP